MRRNHSEATHCGICGKPINNFDRVGGLMYDCHEKCIKLQHDLNK